jgi:hypothetical protein
MSINDMESLANAAHRSLFLDIVSDLLGIYLNRMTPPSC